MNTDSAVRVVVASGTVDREGGSTIQVAVNGAIRRVPTGTTVGDLCRILGVDRGRVAVERNQDVVPRIRYDEVTLEADDVVEVVAFVGGG